MGTSFLVYFAGQFLFNLGMIVAVLYSAVGWLLAAVGFLIMWRAWEDARR